MDNQFQKIKKIRPMEWGLMIILTLIPLIGGIAVSFTTSTNPYREYLRNPSWAPPSWLFGPVWCILYVFIGFSSYLLWKQGGGLTKFTVPAFILFAVQLILNWLWTPFFFGWGYMCWALWDIGAIWLSIVALMLMYIPHTRIGVLLLLPYLLWVSFASALNYSIVTLNGCFLDQLNQTTVCNTEHNAFPTMNPL